MIHNLKIWPEYFAEVKSGNKTFEMRKNDRNFKEGDYVILEEWNPETKQYTGEFLHFQIGYVLNDYPGITEGHCILSLLEFVPKKWMKFICKRQSIVPKLYYGNIYTVSKVQPSFECGPYEWFELGGVVEEDGEPYYFDDMEGFKLIQE